MSDQQQLNIERVKISELKPATYNPRSWSEAAISQLSESIKRFGLVDPLIVNGANGRKNIVIGGHFRLNKNLGNWDYSLLAQFDEALLIDTGFESEELDDIFDVSTETDDSQFDLEKELSKLKIDKIVAKKGDVYELGDSRLMIGGSTVAEEFSKLMNGEKADMLMTDPPYILDYLNAKRHGKPTEGFGSKKNRKYLETNVLPDNFTELWMQNVADHAKPDFSAIYQRSKYVSDPEGVYRQ